VLLIVASIYLNVMFAEPEGPGIQSD